MAEKGWTARVATAAGAAAGTGAAQLGLGYGLGVVVWPVTPTPDDSAWLGSLGWATWITASATVFGAVLGSRFRGGPGPRTSGAWRFALAACAAVGALVTVALIALPARSAVRFDTANPQVVAAGYAVAGLALGLIIAFWAVSSRAVAANLMATGVWLWALAIAAIVVELAVNRESATYLTSWQFAEVANSGLYGTIYWPSALLTLAAAFLVGALTAVPAARRGDAGTGAATSGVAGPLLVAFVFLALAPRLTGALGPIESAYLIAPYAVLAGLAGSVLAVAVTRTLQEQRSHRAGATVTGTARVPEASGLEPSPSGRSTPPRDQGATATTAQLPAATSARGPEAPSLPGTKTAKGTPGDGEEENAHPDEPAKPRSWLFGRRKKPAPGPAASSATEAANRPATVPSPATGKAASTAPSPATGKAAATAPSSRRPSDQDGSGPDKADKEHRTSVEPAPVDAEIAAAARPAPRPRPRKAAEPKPARSTVTPPPTAPAVAQINPKPAQAPPKAPPPSNPKPQTKG
ncbi:MAG: Hansenula MRAKII killer toxin-resistant protein 1 [Actinomycetota bacterium]|nr:Hansenula MRAKII killer toxin-resistant protein 1 [Actinomycetota bacterium]